MVTTAYAASKSKPVEGIIILVVACFRTGYIALWRPAVCISTALISSGTIPGPSAHCWRRQQRHEEGEQRWVNLVELNPSEFSRNGISAVTTDLSSEDIHRKAIEAADDRLLDVEA